MGAKNKKKKKKKKKKKAPPKGPPTSPLRPPRPLPDWRRWASSRLHPWGSRNDNLEHPDRTSSTSTPTRPSLVHLAASAADVRRQLQKLGLEAFLKDTRPVLKAHVCSSRSSLTTIGSPSAVRSCFALQMEKAEPRLYLTQNEQSGPQRPIFIDYLRNERGATAVAPYSPRARAGAPFPPPALGRPQTSRASHLSGATFDRWRSRLTATPGNSSQRPTRPSPRDPRSLQNHPVKMIHADFVAAPYGFGVSSGIIAPAFTHAPRSDILIGDLRRLRGIGPRTIRRPLMTNQPHQQTFRRIAGTTTSPSCPPFVIPLESECSIRPMIYPP